MRSAAVGPLGRARMRRSTSTAAAASAPTADQGRDEQQADGTRWIAVTPAIPRRPAGGAPRPGRRAPSMPVGLGGAEDLEGGEARATPARRPPPTAPGPRRSDRSPRGRPRARRAPIRDRPPPPPRRSARRRRGRPGAPRRPAPARPGAAGRTARGRRGQRVARRTGGERRRRAPERVAEARHGGPLKRPARAWPRTQARSRPGTRCWPRTPAPTQARRAWATPQRDPRQLLGPVRVRVDRQQAPGGHREPGALGGEVEAMIGAVDLQERPGRSGDRVDLVPREVEIVARPFPEHPPGGMREDVHVRAPQRAEDAGRQALARLSRARRGARRRRRRTSRAARRRSRASRRPGSPSRSRGGAGIPRPVSPPERCRQPPRRRTAR